MLSFIFVLIAGALGVATRFVLMTNTPLDLRAQITMTLIINALGSFLIGLLWSLAIEKELCSRAIAQALGMGFLGGFTTFSTFSLDTIRALEAGQIRLAATVFFGSPVLGAALAGLGVFAGRRFL